MLEEFEILVVLKSIFDVESERQVIKYLLMVVAVIFSHCLEESFLIANEKIVREVVVDFYIGSHLTKGVLAYAHELAAWLKVLFGIALSLHILCPIDVPFLVFLRIE